MVCNYNCICLPVFRFSIWPTTNAAAAGGARRCDGGGHTRSQTHTTSKQRERYATRGAAATKIRSAHTEMRQNNGAPMQNNVTELFMFTRVCASVRARGSCGVRRMCGLP